jgi:HSP20 family protein
MAIQRWDPQRDLVRLQENVKQMFEEVLGRSSWQSSAERNTAADWKPPLDLLEEPGHYLLRADLPGVVPSDVELRIENGNLIVVGERKMDQAAYLRMERPTGRFSAQIALPPSVDRQNIQANHCNGVLEVVLPKRKEETPSRIEVAGVDGAARRTQT